MDFNDDGDGMVKDVIDVHIYEWEFNGVTKPNR